MEKLSAPATDRGVPDKERTIGASFAWRVKVCTRQCVRRRCNTPRCTYAARIVICGTASISSWNPIPQGPRVERHLLVKRARMQGFVVFDFSERYGEAREKLAQWVKDGTIRYREDILDGIENAPGAIAGIYRGENVGKRLIRIAQESG